MDTKLTMNLQKGDIVVFADLVDEVQSVLIEGVIARVDVIRRKIGDRDMAVPMFWYAGIQSIQNVQTKGE